MKCKEGRYDKKTINETRIAAKTSTYGECILKVVKYKIHVIQSSKTLYNYLLFSLASYSLKK